MAVLSAIKTTLASVAPTWRVVRGPVNWSTLAQGNFQTTASILFSEYSLLPTNGVLRSGTITIEVVERMPKDIEIGMNDTGLDELAKKIEEFVDALAEIPMNPSTGRQPVSRVYGRSPGDPSVGLSSPTIREIVGADWSVQGIELTMAVDY